MHCTNSRRPQRRTRTACWLFMLLVLYECTSVFGKHRRVCIMQCRSVCFAKEIFDRQTAHFTEATLRLFHPLWLVRNGWAWAYLPLPFLNPRHYLQRPLSHISCSLTTLISRSLAQIIPTYLPTTSRRNMGRVHSRLLCIFFPSSSFELNVH